MALGSKFSDTEKSKILGIGESGTSFARRINEDAPKLKVETLRFDRDRYRRELTVGSIPEVNSSNILPVDDVAVSGRTVEVVREKLGDTLRSVGVGLLYDSRRTRARIGIQDIRFGLIYSRIGGGIPPMNSLASLGNAPGTLNELANRYFEGSEEFKRLIGGEL